jgi:hypothetical protein
MPWNSTSLHSFMVPRCLVQAMRVLYLVRSNVRHFEVDEAVELKWRLCHFQWHELPTEL